MAEHEHRPKAGHMPNRRWWTHVLTASPRRLLYLRDWVYGGIDGAVTTFAVVAGVAGASLDTSIILILGGANLVADGFSMAAGSYSATRTDGEQYERVRQEVRRAIAETPEHERADVRHALIHRGVTGPQLDAMVEQITANEKDWLETLLIEREKVVPLARHPLQAAASTYAAFLVCGAVPLIPYLVGAGFSVAAVATAAVFFAIGALKSRWAGRSWLRSGAGTLGIGVLAAAFAYGIGALLKIVVGAA